ncbi:MAG: dihydroorotate dehydrogenase electron transfer subunit [Deltaproteobacteria bacterium]|nr:dihydroorotate dehydrogenase electron transfer subunit [Deltaproteobacteria bacterium]
MQSVSSKILYNEEVLPRYFRLGLQWKTPAIVPGHFLMVRVSGSLDPLLRRPFGVYKVLGSKWKSVFRGTGVELLYQVVGRGTKILSEKRAGESVDILGPLGNGFPDPERKQNPIMIAGGMGIVPLRLLAEKLKRGVVLFGARGSSEAGIVKGFRGLGCRVKVATEDGSIGRRGLVTGLLKEEITPDSPDSVVYACGPVGMLKEAARIAQAEGVKCHVSLERSMACGIGVCLGCAVKTRAREEFKRYKMVCSDGPVFDSKEIDWEAL